MKQWEEKGKRILETVFDGEGAVLQQKLLELDSKGLEAQIEREIRSAAVPEVMLAFPVTSTASATAP